MKIELLSFLGLVQYNINKYSAYAVMKLIKRRWGASAQTICRFGYFLREGQFVIVDNSRVPTPIIPHHHKIPNEANGPGMPYDTTANRRKFIVTTPTMDSGKPTLEVATLIAPTARVAKPLVPTSTWGFIYGEDEHHDAATPSRHFSPRRWASRCRYFE
jgi:hypothetical protein